MVELLQQTENGFTQVQIAYLMVITYLDELVQPTHNIHTNQAIGTAQAFLACVLTF